MTVGGFLRAGSLLLGLPLGLGVVPLYRFAGRGVAGGFLGGSLLAAAGAGIWLAGLLWSRGRRNRVFLGLLFGGILFRLALFLAGIAIAIHSGLVHFPAFLASLFLFYVGFLILEVRLAGGISRTLAPTAGEEPG